MEAILAGGPGDRAVIQLTAPLPKLDWNLHGHAGGTQVVEEELGIMTTTYVFTPSVDADWYLLLRNQHTAELAVDVRVELYGDITWEGWD